MSDATQEVRTDEAEHRDDEPESGDEAADEEYDHLDDVEDGSGCTEIWEHLSEQRDDD